MRIKELYWQSLGIFKNIACFVDNKLKPFYIPHQQRNNCGLYAININTKVGFFAQLNWCLRIFAHCERFNLTPYIILSSPFYTLSRGENWFEYYFDNIRLTVADRKLIENGQVKISSISDSEQMGIKGLYSDDGSLISLVDANRLLERNLRIKSDIQDYVDSFVDKHFKRKMILGVHYRGTDKKSEADPVSWEFCAKIISNYLNANPKIGALFVSSDEWAFIQWIQTEFPRIEVIFHDDKERSRDGMPIHKLHTVGDNYTKGKEALVNCLLLSKCNVLIRSASFLSGWSSIFNPYLPVIMLNRPYTEKLWFPDSVIVRSSMDRYLPSQI